MILAGGAGSRLRPATNGVSKHLLLVHDKPMIYYPLTTLMLAGVRDITIVVNPGDKGSYEALLGDGREFGVRIAYAVQQEPNGLPSAMLTGLGVQETRPSIDEKLLLILGDNIFFGPKTGESIRQQVQLLDSKECLVFSKMVNDPSRFGVIVRRPGGEIDSLVEKPSDGRSNEAITGMYAFGSDFASRLTHLTESKRGETEIVDLLSTYIPSKLRTTALTRSNLWADLGEIESLSLVSRFVESYQETTRELIGSPHEVASRKGWVSKQSLEGPASSAYWRLLQAALRFN